MNSLSFSQLMGNDNIKKQLNCMISKNAVTHALLFAGPNGIGKSLFAKALAAKLVGRVGITDQEHETMILEGKHPDIHIYKPEGKLGFHSIQSMREFGDEVHLPAYEKGWKVFIIYEADRMMTYSANALLKTFEEPPPQTLIILLSHSATNLLPTILSRCSVVRFQALSFDEVQDYLKHQYALDEIESKKIALQSQGSLGRAMTLIENGDLLRIECLKLFARFPFENYRLLQKNIESLCEQIELARKKVEVAGREEFGKFYPIELTAHQKEAMEKELEGLVAVSSWTEMQILFGHILSWYRDMQLLLLKGSSSLLMNPDFEAELDQSIQRGEFLPIEEVQEAIDEAHLVLQRSTSLSICLESLFLKLKRVA